MQQSPYDILGEQGIRQLVDAFYDAMDRLPEAANIRAMHADDLMPMRRMLTAYLTTWMGGPPVYIALKGGMCLTDAHAGFAIGPRARDQWLLCMRQALDEIDATDELKTMLEVPFQRIADAVQNQHTDSGREAQLIARG